MTPSVIRISSSASATPLRDTFASQPNSVVIFNELRSFRAAFDLKLDQLTEQLDLCIRAVETALSIIQAYIVALADRVTIVEEGFLKISSVPVTPLALPSAIVSSSTNCHFVHAAGSLASVISMSYMLHKLRQRNNKKNNIVISGLMPA